MAGARDLVYITTGSHGGGAAESLQKAKREEISMTQGETGANLMAQPPLPDWSARPLGHRPV